MPLKGKAAVVTGGGRGIGRVVALDLARAGARVVVNDPGVSREGSPTWERPADEVVAEIRANGGEAVADFNSVADFDAAAAIIQTCIDQFGSIDILVNCAGVLRERMVWNLTEDDWDTVLSVHLKGTFNTTRHAAGHMRQQRWGRIINFASDAWRGTVGQSNYGAAKGGIVSFTRSIARELGRYGITANAVCPVAATRMTMNEGVKAGLKKRLEAGIITEEYYNMIMAMPGPEYVAPLVTYLASDKARNINGQVFHAEKGRVSIYTEPVEGRALYKTADDGMFSFDELAEAIPRTLLVGYTNPAPAETPPGDKR